MNRSRALIAVCFCAGMIGALINSFAVWLCGAWGLTALAGVKLAPAWTAAWVYPRLFWGGLWGLVFYLSVGHPRTHRHWARKGLWISLLPTAFQLFYIFPYRTPNGMMGMALGDFTPLFVLLFNGIWGLFTGIFARAFWGRG